MHFSGRVKNLVSHFLSVPAGVRGVVLFALMFFTGMGNVWGETYTYSSDTTITSSNFAAGDTITINNNAKLTINLMGQNVNVATINIGNGSPGNLIINGPGTLNVGIFDPDENVKNRIEINNYANLVVTGIFYADKKAADAVTIITGDRTGSLSITGNVDYSTENDSGVFFDAVNVNVLSDIDNLVKYSWDKMKASSEGIGITVERTFKGQAKKEKIFYKVVFSHSTRAGINGSVEFAEKTSGTESTESKDISIEFNNNPEGEHDFENTGDYAKLILYAPDGVTELETVAYYYQRPVWNGSESDDGYDVKNWGLAAGTDVSELLKFFKSNQIMLNSDLPRYPVFGVVEKTVEFKSLVVSSGASVTVSAGELIAGELSVKGSGVLNTNGGKITISGDSTISNLNLGSEMKVTGGTTVITSLKTNGNCSVEISSGAEVYVTNSYLGENCSGKLSWTSTGTLTIPRSGANVDFGTQVPDYGARLDVKAAGAATYYSANDLTADGSLILTRVSGSSDGVVRYPYILNTTTVTKKVRIAETEYDSSSPKTGYFEVPAGSANKIFAVSGLLNIDENSSFIMTFYSPDRKFSLGSISYTKTSSGYLWTGNSSSDWSVRDNWSGLDASEQPDRMAGKTLIVDYANFTGNKKYPNINNTSTAGTIIIKNGAYITANNNNELTVGKILCMGDAYFSATQGCVIFSDDVIPSDDVNFSDGASFTAANPDKSKFNNVKIDGNFTANSKMSVAENFSAEGLGGKTITLNDNVIVGGNLLLSGTETGPGVREMLSVEGGAGNYFKISNTQNYGLYLSVADGLKIGENGGTSSVVYKAYYCDRNSAANEAPLGWVLSTEKPKEFIWTGLYSTKWSDKDNWKDENNSPVIVAPDYTTGMNEIIIDEASVNSLVFDDDDGIPEGTELKLKSLKIPSSKKVCIADCYVIADSITVDGTIALFGTQAKYPLGVNGGKVDWGADSTIEYYGSYDGAKDILYASVDSETGTQKYQNIKLSCGPILFENALDVAGNFTNDSADQITFAKNVKAASPINFASSVKLSGNVIFDVPAVTFKSAFNAGLISEDSAREIVFTGNVSSEGDFTAAAGITEFKGNVDFSGSNFIHNGGTVIISGTDNLLTVKTDGSTVFNNLTANSSKATLNGAFSVIRDFLVETDVECEMNGALTISGNFTNNGTFKAGKSDSDSYELKIAKNFVNNGSFDAKSGTVLFTGTEISNISGETKWFNFKAETPGKTLIFQAGKIQEILNSLIITGSASDDKSSNVVLKSSTDGEFWFIKTAVNDSNLSVDYASIKDSKCTEKSIVANNSDDLGNTSGWIFPGLLYTWVGNESDLWSVSKNWSPASLPGKLSWVLIPDGKVIKADMDIEIQKLDLKPKATFDLASHKITINGSGNYLTNEGTIKLNGIENQVEAAVKNLPDSWIEYYGGTAENPSKNVIKEEYYNLKIYSDADFDNLSDNTDVPVIINGNLVLAESAKMTFEKNVQICGDLIENGNNLVLKGNFEVANVQSENGKHISITFNGPVAGKTEQTLYYSSLSDKKSVNIQNLDIKNTKVVTNVSFNVYGKWNNNGEFTASDGTVKIVEGGTISGNNNFASFVFEKNGGKLSFDGKNSYKSLSIVAPGGEIKFAPGEENAQSVTESLILRGSKDSLMLLSSLPSSRNASQWFINCSNSEAADMRFIKVFDSYANKATSARLVALESRNGGNNINWQFPGLAIALTAAAIGQNQMYIVFDRTIDIAKSKLENTLYFINSEGSLLSDLKIQKATAIHNSTESTGFACSLSRTIQFEDILNVYVIYRSDGENYIATPTSDFMSDNESHALSDFAVNAVEPLYAYDNRQASLNSDYFKTGINIEESLAVHDWNEEQQKNGSLIYNSDIFIKVRKNYSTRLEDSDKTTEKISLYFDTEPDKDASSAYYNSIFGEKLRVWLPSVTSEGKSVLPIEMMARKNNVPKGTLTAESENSEFKYNFNNDSLSMSNGINSGDQVKFIFGLEDREICRVPIVTGNLSGFTVDASNKSPLFALRLKNSKDISSLDLWSFRLKEITSQRGGVTILNNVIDTSRGDIATVKVDMSGSGSLSVIVMTLDGNVVQYLQHGTASGGEHYYSWNGKTKGGKTVARGMYFVRVIGSGFDETRKIMVVRE